MVIDTEKYEELLEAAHVAVKQMKHSNNLLMKLLRVYAPSQPLMEAMNRLAAAVHAVEVSNEVYMEGEHERTAREEQGVHRVGA